MLGPAEGDWLALLDAPLPVAEALAWAVTPACGATVCFLGTVRDHADGRDQVTALTYEAYETAAIPRMSDVVGEIRRRWPVVGRVAILHRTGELVPGDAAVAIVLSTPHRSEAFSAAQFGIDAVKATVPIWKQESWAGGVEWATGSQPLRAADEVDGASAAEFKTGADA